VEFLKDRIEIGGWPGEHEIVFENQTVSVSRGVGLEELDEGIAMT
jgi:hypothetical protein